MFGFGGCAFGYASSHELDEWRIAQKKAFRRLSLSHHPDRLTSQQKDEMGDEYKKIVEMYI
eukprot:1348047-Amorphochlora_amoeboformis.AAC.1